MQKTVFFSPFKRQAGKLIPVGDRAKTCLQEVARVSPVFFVCDHFESRI